MTLLERCQDNQYMIRKKILKLIGAAFHVYDSAGGVVLYVKQKGFKLKEDIRVFSGEDMQQEMLCIAARQILDFKATYDVTDSTSGEKIGALRRKALKSFLRDEWLFLDASDREIGMLQEDNMVLALVRRFITALVPQEFTGTIGGTEAVHFKRHFNPFVLRMDIDFSVGPQGLLDRRLGVAAAILLAAIEGRQN
jgi:uncharacterized protein YxjI